MKICLVCEGISATEQTRCSSCGLQLVATTEVHFPVRRGEEDAAHPLLGALVGDKYRITNVLGKGGMGTVFRAIHEVSLAPVALKVLRPRFAGQEGYRRSFLAEARKAGSVVHEHSARILDVGEQPDGSAYIAMELVQGTTLEEWLRARRPLAPAHVVDIVHQICQALAAAHEVGVVHRDLSPRNVMAQVRDGRPWIKILDFGIAKAASLAGGAEAPPEAFASPPYSAPEHLAGHETDARADLYGLGVIAYEALTARVPVEETDRAGMVRATIEGRLRPLRAPAGTPARLTRLIGRLLARDPRQRPASPAAVIAELEQIRRPRGQLLRGAALLLLVPSTAAFLLTHLEPSEPYLQPRPGAAFAWSRSEPGPDQPAAEIRSDQLRQLSFFHGGFDARALEVAAYRGRVPLQARNVAARAAGADELILDAAHSPGYGEFLQTLATLPDPVVLVFGIPDRAPLGYARVLVDDEGPMVRIDAAVEQRGVLGGDALVTVSASDKGTLRELELRVRRGLSPPVAIPLPAAREATRRARELLGAVFDDVQPVANVALELVGRDAAGNTSAQPAILDFAWVDLAAPRILRLGGGRVIAYGPEGADLQLHLDGYEPDLLLSVLTPAGREISIPYVASGTQLRITLVPEGNGGPLFVPGAYAFRLRDPAGNTSEYTAADLVFHSSDTEASLAVRGAAAAVVIGRRVVCDGGPLSLVLRCNPFYRPERAALVRGSGEAVSSAAQARLSEAEFGGCAIGLGALADGAYRLEAELADAEGARRHAVVFTIDVLGTPVELRLPDTSPARFLAELVALDVFREADGGRITQGRSWSLVPPDAGLLRGRLWIGRPGSLTPVEVSAERAAGGGWFGELLPVRGENVVAVELSDLLGRPVSVTIGGRPAAALVQPEARTLREIARFHHRDTSRAPQSIGVRVEYGEPVRLPVEGQLPFRVGDDLRLRIGGFEVAAAEVRAVGEVANLLFVVPFEALAQAADLHRLAREEFVARRAVPLAAELRTPAGTEAIALTLHPTLSTLRPLSLGELSGERTLPESLAAIRLVPVVGPGLGRSVRDPVPSGAAGRETFRPFPPLDVRNVTQFFLQEGELTRRQYFDAIEMLGRIAPDALPWTKIVHAADPLGRERLAALRPRGHTARALELAADRPVTGVDFFQAHAMASAIGWLVAGDAELLRLPMGLELEIGALGFGDAPPRPLHGGGRVMAGAQRAAALRRSDPLRWPPTMAESRAAGDVIPGMLGFDLVALDFGVREWVLDLPYVGVGHARTLLEEWLRDHAVHVDRARALARGEGGEDLGDLAPLLAQRGVVRGLASGELRGLIDARDGRLVDPQAGSPLPATVPGVVRTLIVRRDGAGPMGEPDPHLESLGLRLAGGEKFVAEARRR
jgi:serine/threonine protein kinase